jgi:hypothetical protein
MRLVIPVLAISALLSINAFAQKGVDTQTKKIKADTNKSTSRENDASKSFDWGKGKTKVRDRLDNPYRFSARRDALVENVLQALRERNIILDEAASRIKDGIVVSQPYVFAKGPVIAPSELSRYGVISNTDSAWTRGQYTLTVEVQPVDGIRNNVFVTAKVEGRAGNGLTTEWSTVQSSGLAEDEFLAKLVELVTGTSPDVPQDTSEKPHK